MCTSVAVCYRSCHRSSTQLCSIRKTIYAHMSIELFAFLVRLLPQPLACPAAMLPDIPAEEVSTSPHFQRLQSLINFMVNSPIQVRSPFAAQMTTAEKSFALAFTLYSVAQKARTEAYKAMNWYLYLFPSETRFAFLKLLFTACPYPNVISTFILRLKDEVNLDWNSEKPVFASPRIKVRPFPRSGAPSD